MPPDLFCQKLFCLRELFVAVLVVVKCVADESGGVMFARRLQRMVKLVQIFTVMLVMFDHIPQQSEIFLVGMGRHIVVDVLMRMGMCAAVLMAVAVFILDRKSVV